MSYKKEMETVQEAAEETMLERDLNLLIEMTLKMEHELKVALKERE